MIRRLDSCAECQRLLPVSEMTLVETDRQTWDSPAAYDWWCPDCLEVMAGPDENDRAYDEIVSGDREPPLWWRR